MSGDILIKPYLVRAIHGWCTDNGYSPYVSALEGGCSGIPSEFFQNGKVILNISYQATTNLLVNNEEICFITRFNGTSTRVEIGIGAVDAIFSKESGQGLTFTPEINNTVVAGELGSSKEHPVLHDEQAAPPVNSNRDKSSFLRIVK